MRRNDCLSTIRLLAAINVVWNHSSTHLQLDGIPVAVSRLFVFFHGIPIFFTLSGFLIWMSIGRSKSFGEYCQKRFWRIYPELWVAVVVEIVAILIFIRDIDWFKLGVFAVGQGTIFPFWVPEFLRSYGCGTPNGALWSIFALVQFYVLAFPAYRCLHGKGIGRWMIVFAGVVLLSVAFRPSKDLLPINLGKLLSISFVPTFWMFMLGAWVSEYKDKVLPAVLRFWYVPVVLRAASLVVHVPELPTCFYGFFHTIIALFVALSIGYKFPFLNIKVDVSYGIYIYHMTVINVMIMLGFVKVGFEGFVVAACVTCIIAWLSSMTVGAFSRRMKMCFEIVTKKRKLEIGNET